MEDFQKTWITPRPFNDVQGNHLKLGDIVYRIDYNNLTLTILSHISQSGETIVVKSAFVNYFVNGDQVSYNKTYQYDPEYLKNRGYSIVKGQLNGWASSKLIKVNLRGLTPFQQGLVQELRNSINL